MYGLNAFALILFCIINILAYQLCKANDRIRTRVITVLCALLLGGNLIRYGIIYPFVIGRIQIPVEFSTVTYFAMPAVLLTGRTRMKSWAAYSGLMAGFFYYLAMITAGGPLYGDYPIYDVYISMFCHGTLYFCGFVTAATVPFAEKEGKKLMLGTALVAGRALLLRPLTDSSQRLFIYILLDGTVLKSLLPHANLAIALPLYYVLIVGILFLTIKGFFRRNRAEYQKFSKMRKRAAL